MVLSFKPGLDRTRIWSRNESHQSFGSDPTGQKGEGARVCSSFRERNASPSGICYAGILCVMLEIMALLSILLKLKQNGGIIGSGTPV